MKYLTAFELFAAATAEPPQPLAPTGDSATRLRYLEAWDRTYAAHRVTTAYDVVTRTVRMHGSRSSNGASALVVLTGLPNTGKSQTSCFIAERFTRERLGSAGEFVDSRGPETLRRVPVVRIQATHTDTVKAGILAPIVEFYGASPGRRNAAELLRSIRQLARQHATELLVVDEISQVRLGKNSSRVVDQIKELVEAFPAPILFVGNSLDRDSIFTASPHDPSDPRRQLSERAVFITSGLWSAEEVEQLARSVERDLPLRNHTRGSLNYGELRARCGGYPGKVIDALRDRAVAAIESGSEEITDADLAEAS